MMPTRNHVTKEFLLQAYSLPIVNYHNAHLSHMLRQNYSVGESENTYLILMEIHREIKIPLSYLFFCPKIQIVKKLKKK